MFFESWYLEVAGFIPQVRATHWKFFFSKLLWKMQKEKIQAYSNDFTKSESRLSIIQESPQVHYLHETKELERGKSTFSCFIKGFLPTIIRDWFHVPRAQLFNFTIVPSDSPWKKKIIKSYLDSEVFPPSIFKSHLQAHLNYSYL